MKVDTQDIPSELYDDYITSLRPVAPWWSNYFGTFKFATRKFGKGTNVFVVRKRQPFRIPHMQGLGPNTPSGEQILVRRAFKRCVDCFGEQPNAGGATPPAIGPRNRSWWFNDAASSGLWYFDYFIQQSWSSFFAHLTPIWCKVAEYTALRAGVQKYGDAEQATHAGYSAARAGAWSAYLAHAGGGTGYPLAGMRGAAIAPNEDLEDSGGIEFAEYRTHIKFDLTGVGKPKNCSIQIQISFPQHCTKEGTFKLYKNAAWKTWGSTEAQIASAKSTDRVSWWVGFNVSPDDVNWGQENTFEIRFNTPTDKVVSPTCTICTDEQWPACVAPCTIWDINYGLCCTHQNWYFSIDNAKLITEV